MSRPVEAWIKEATADYPCTGSLNEVELEDLRQQLADACPYGWRPMSEKPRAIGAYPVKAARNEVWRGEHTDWDGSEWKGHLGPGWLWLDDGRPADRDPDEEAFQRDWKANVSAGEDADKLTCAYWYRLGRRSQREEDHQL